MHWTEIADPRSRPMGRLAVEDVAWLGTRRSSRRSKFHQHNPHSRGCNDTTPVAAENLTHTQCRKRRTHTRDADVVRVEMTAEREHGEQSDEKDRAAHSQQVPGARLAS